MMRRLITGSIRFRLLLLAAAATLLAVGAVRLGDMSKDVLPEFAPPYIEVQTEALGLSAAEVESLVSVNLEELLNGTPWLDSIRSTSVPGLSSVVLTFKPGTDVRRVRQLVAERLTLAYALPNVSKPPVILQPLSATSRLMAISLSSRRVSPIQMSVLARWTIRPALLAVPGVANVAIWGFRDRQLQVLVDPRQLARDSVSLDQIVRTAGNAMWVSPLTYLEASTPGAGGWIESPQQRLEVRHVFPISGPSGLAKVDVEDLSRPLGQVARVVEGHPPLIGDAALRDGTGLLLVVEKFPGADTTSVTRGVDRAMAGLAPGLGGITADTTVFRPATFIHTASHNLTLAMLIGGLLLLLALGVLLYSWRALVVAFVAIAVSLVAAALLLNAFGETMNAMVFGGLAIALAVVVDEAIVDFEAVMRRLRASRAGEDVPVTTTIVDGMAAMRRPALYGTLIALLPLLPVLALRGVSGSLFKPLTLAYALAVSAAFVAALLVTPALSSVLLSFGSVERRESPAGAWLARAYSTALSAVVRRRGAVIATAVVGLAAGAAAIGFLGRSQVPEFKDSNLVVRWEAPPGTSEPEMSRITERVSAELRGLPGVRSVAGEIGRAVLGDQIVDVNSGELLVSLDPDADRDATVASVREVVDGYPGLARGVQTYESQALRRAQTGSSDPIVVKVFGPAFGILDAQAERVRHVLAGVKGVRAVHMDRTVVQPQVDITVRLRDAQRYGLKPGDVRREAATLLAGLGVGSLFEEQKVFDVAVWSRPATRTSLYDVQNLLLDTPSGDHVRLRNVANVQVGRSPAIIRREAVSRLVNIGLDVRGRDVGAVTSDVRNRLAAMAFPLEFHAEVTGDATTGNGSRNGMIGAGVAAAILIFLLLQAALRSWSLAAAIFLALPVALVGAVLAALGAGEDVTLGSLLAFLAVLALAARHALALIAHCRDLEHEEGVPFGPDLVLRGARERLVPIAATTLAVGLALLPVVIIGVIPGHEVLQPIAVIVLGGLVTSALVNLFLIPVLYLRFGSRSAPEERELLAS